MSRQNLGVLSVYEHNDIIISNLNNVIDKNKDQLKFYIKHI